MKQKSASVVVPLLRYAHKRNGRLTGGVTYIVAASDWTPENRHTYEVTLFHGKSSSCSCPSRSSCKHRDIMEHREQQRREHAPLNGNKPYSLLRAS